MCFDAASMAKCTFGAVDMKHVESARIPQPPHELE